MTTKTKANIITAAIGVTILTVFLVKGPYHGDPIFTMRWTNANTILMTCTNLMQRDWQGATSNQLTVKKDMTIKEPQRFYRAWPIAWTNGTTYWHLAWQHSPSNTSGYLVSYGNGHAMAVGYTNQCTVPLAVGEEVGFSVRATNDWTNSDAVTLSNLAIKL